MPPVEPLPLLMAWRAQQRERGRWLLLPAPQTDAVPSKFCGAVGQPLLLCCHRCCWSQRRRRFRSWDLSRTWQPWETLLDFSQ